MAARSLTRAARKVASVSLSEEAPEAKEGAATVSSGDATFPRAAHLVKAKDFLRLRAEGQRVGTRHLSAQVSLNGAGRARLGLAVSKRVSKKAVRRNRIKRVARESFRQLQNTLPPFDILVIARASANAETNAGLRDELFRLWQRIVALNATVPTGTMRD